MILVIGDVMTDVLVHPEGQAAPGTDQPARILRRPGGSGANIACWLGHAGVPVRFAGRVAEADVAEHEAALRRHGVEPHLTGDRQRQTGSTVALVGPEGGRGFFADKGANLGLTVLPPALLDGVRALHVSGHSLLAPGPRAAARQLMDAAHARGLAVSVDAGSAGWLAAAGAESFRAWTRGVSLCFANADEAALLDGGYEVFVVTLGAAGAEARAGAETLRVPATAAEIVDGIGAGDAFAAGFLVARLAGLGVSACLRAGTDLAARCLGVSGGRPPDRGAAVK